MARLALLSLSLLLFSFYTNNTTVTQAQCLPDQHHALIQLKKGYKTTGLTTIHPWNASTDCCKWDGITCNEQTGMVTELNLFQWYLTGELNSALFNLSSLQYLNLAGNFFNIPLPQTGFERLANLTHLDLSISGLVSQVPIGISALTNLIYLDLSNFIYSANPSYLHDTGLKTLLGNLTKLQVLHLGGVDISLNGSEWGKAVLQVGSTLQELIMVDCGLRGNFPDEIFLLTNLTYLDLAYNSMLSGELPEFLKHGFLQYLDLSNTNFTGPLPDSIRNLQYLSGLDLSNCNFFGEIPPSITNLTRLEHLNLGSNILTGTIPMSLFSHPSLEYLFLSNNQLSRILIEFPNGSSILAAIYLDNNNLQGQLPYSIFKSPQLTNLILESNNFTGTLNLDIIKHNKKLSVLILSNNKVSIREEKIHNESFYASFPQIFFLSLSSCNLTNFPTFLRYQTSIGHLDLSYNKIEGAIPNWLCTRTSISSLDLSHNFFSKIEEDAHLTSLSNLVVLDIHSNRMSGPVPLLPPGIQYVDFSSNYFFSLPAYFASNCNTLEVLDLGNNEIMNRFPFWLGDLKILTVLILRSNKFYGRISNMEATRKTNNSFFPTIRVFDISSNRFRGNIPKIIFDNLKAIVTNSDSLTPHYWNSYYYQNSITVISKGQEMEVKKSLRIFSSLDLSQNGFSGEIPVEIGQLKLLDVLNLSHNALIGPIPLEFANLQQLQSLDLSSNQLYGQIPQELTSLTFLSVLNLSYNNLVGEIPQAHQFYTFPSTSYLGNPGLCGDPLSMQCPTPSNHVFNKALLSQSSNDIIGLSVSIGLGLGVGFASVIWALVSWEIGRMWFNFLIDGFYFQHFH